MTKEWYNEYNPFNSWKSLIHSKNYEGIINNEYKIPIVANIDPTNQCNLKCNFCMFLDRSKVGYRKNNSNTYIPTEILFKIPKFLSEWGVKAFCVAGGGEPTLHKNIKEFLILCKKFNIETLFVTNGIKIDSDIFRRVIINNVKEIGFSVNAGSWQVYKSITGSNFFNQVIDNIKKLVEMRNIEKSELRITYKFILDEYNIFDIYNAIGYAKNCGVDFFQFRPAEHPNPNVFYEKNDVIFQQIDEARKDFECDTFNIFAIQHKFMENFSKKNTFSKCPSPLTITLAANGKVYLCPDMRGHDSKYLCDFFDDLQNIKTYWNSEYHKSIVNNVKPLECIRCTGAKYGEFIDNIFINDNMNKNLI